MNVTGAFFAPSSVPFWGMPSKSAEDAAPLVVVVPLSPPPATTTLPTTRIATTRAVPHRR